jgi:hypothetical protein
MCGCRFFMASTPQERRDDKTKELTGMNYNCSVLLPKGDPQIQKVKDAMAAAKKAKWGDSPPRLLAPSTFAFETASRSTLKLSTKLFRAAAPAFPYTTGMPACCTSPLTAR